MAEKDWYKDEIADALRQLKTDNPKMTVRTISRLILDDQRFSVSPATVSRINRGFNFDVKTRDAVVRWLKSQQTTQKAPTGDS